MSKARTLSNFVSSGNPLADGAIAASEVTGLSTVATSGTYADLSGKPTLSTVAATGAYADLSGKPSLATVATSGSYNDLSNKPTITATANDLSGGAAGSIPYQAGEGDTAMLAAGTAGQILMSNGAAAPTWATPAPGAGVFTAIASGAITQGQPVVVNSNSTVSQVTGSYATTPTNVDNGTSVSTVKDYGRQQIAYDPVNKKFVILYQNNSTNYLMYVAGYINSAGTMTLGTPTVISSSYLDNLAIIWAGDRFAFVYRVPGSAAYINTATFSSGTTLSFGTASAAFGSNPLYPAITYNATTNQVYSFWYNFTNGNTATFFAHQLSGTSAPSKVKETDVFPSCAGGPFAIEYNPAANNIFVSAKGGNSAQYGVALTYIGGTLTGGDWQYIGSSSTNYMATSYDASAQKVVVIYQNASGGQRNMFAQVASMSGTTLTLETANNFYYNGAYPSCVYSPTLQKTAVVYQDVQPYSYYGFLVNYITVSGTTATVSGADIVRSDIYPTTNSITFDSDNVSFITAAIASNTIKSNSLIYPLTTNLTANNFVGFSSATYANNATATVNTVGFVDTNQTGLTPATKYYVSSLGGINTTSTTNPLAGTAVATTKIIVKA